MRSILVKTELMRVQRLLGESRSFLNRLPTSISEEFLKLIVSTIN